MVSERFTFNPNFLGFLYSSDDEKIRRGWSFFCAVGEKFKINQLYLAMASPTHSAAMDPDHNESKGHDDSGSDDDIPISLSHSLANSPRFVSASFSPVENTATEINPQEPLNAKSSREVDLDNPETISNESPSINKVQNLDLSDAIVSNDEQNSEERAVGSPSECSDDAAVSTRALKSSRSNSGTYIQCSADAYPKGSRRGRRARIRSVSSSDESVVVTDEYANEESISKRVVNDSKDGLEAEVSTRLGNERSASMKRFTSPNSPNPTINTIATSSTATRAEKSLYVPFLPKFLRVRGTSTERQTRQSVDETEDERMKEVKPEIQDESSDVDGKNEATVHETRRGILRRPLLVQRASNTVLGLKDMLRTTGPADTENVPGPPNRKLKKMFGEDPDFSEGSNLKRADLIGIPLAHNDDLPTFPQEVGRTVPKPSGLEIWQNPMPTQVDGLRSHPIQRSSTMPTGKRKVGFSPPLDIEIKPEHRFLRQSIVSTPYPLRHQEERMIGSTSTLTLVLNSQRDSVPVVKTIVIPEQRGTTDLPSHGENKTINAINRNFDDEELFRLIKTEYKGMRWRFHNKISARRIQSLNIISYNELCSVAGHKTSPLEKPSQIEDSLFTRPQLLSLFRAPELGRNQHQWVDSIVNRPRHHLNEEPGPPPEHEARALELIEGWSVGRIIAALIAVATSSLLATLLWIFLGVGAEHSSYFAAAAAAAANDGSSTTPSVDLTESSWEFHDAGGRVQGGAALGALVLMLGWTGVGAWAFLCWLV